MRYVDCTVTIHDDETASYADTNKRDAKDKILDDELVLLTIERVQDWIASNAASGRGDLELLGRCLYRLLFHNKLGKEFEKTFQVFEDDLKAGDRNVRLRLILEFHRESGQLAGLPWEFIFFRRPDKGIFLAGQMTELILTRFVPESPEQTREKLHPADEALRILVVVSSPKELATVGGDDTDEVVQKIRQLETSGASVEEMAQPRRVELQQRIEDFKPHVLHFIGHGSEGKIALIREEHEIEADEIQGEPRMEANWITSDTLGSMFEEFKPRLVFLHACKGAASFMTSLSSFTSTARELVYSRIPAVVGMQYEIENEDAALFAKTFYEEIARGRPIDEAVTEGRRRLGRGEGTPQAWADRRFGTPLVYLQSKEPIILASAAAETTVEPPSVPVERVPCPYPDACTGMVTAEHALCVVCRRELKLCPNGHVMGVQGELGCPKCPYVNPEAAVGVPESAAEQAPSASDVLRITEARTEDVGIA